MKDMRILIAGFCLHFFIAGSGGAITMSPANRAVLMGSARVNTSCTSSYGFQAISWSYIPVGARSIAISYGGSTITTSQRLYYAVEQSPGSEQSNLIILSAATSRAGTYTCYDFAFQASAQLIVINSDPVCNMTPKAPTELLYNQPVQMSCSITYTANSYVSVDMSWSKDSSATIVPLQTTTSGYLITAVSSIAQTPGYHSPFPIYRCNTTFKITGNPTGSANNTLDYSKSTPLFNSTINVIYLNPAISSSTAGARHGDQVYLGTTVTCNVDANPRANYSWLDVTYGNKTNTSSIQIWHSGQYQCTAWNRAAATSLSINVTTYRTTAASTTATITSSSNSLSGSGGLSGGSNIGIGVGIGIIGMLVLVGVLFAILRRRYEVTKRAKPDDKRTTGMEELSEKNRTIKEDSTTPQYEPFNAISANPGPTYEQLTTSTNVGATKESHSGRATYDNLGSS